MKANRRPISSSPSRVGKAERGPGGISQARLEARAKVLKALAHPTRLRIIEELARGEQCVCALQEIVGGDLSTVSKHLLVLKNAHLVSIEKRGLQIFYSLKAFCTINFLDCIEEIVHDSAREQIRLLPDQASRPVASVRRNAAKSCSGDRLGACRPKKPC